MERPHLKYDYRAAFLMTRKGPLLTDCFYFAARSVSVCFKIKECLQHHDVTRPGLSTGSLQGSICSMCPGPQRGM